MRRAQNKRDLRAVDKSSYAIFIVSLTNQAFGCARKLFVIGRVIVVVIVVVVFVVKGLAFGGTRQVRVCRANNYMLTRNRMNFADIHYAEFALRK